MPDISSKDFSFFSGERQTATELSQIRFDHLSRYQFAKEFIDLNLHSTHFCLDLFCGNGYGTFLLSEAFPSISFKGIDGSKDAIKCANEYYSLANNSYENKVYPFSHSEKHDLVVCFESLEHVENDSSLITLIYNCLNKGGYLLLSVPNESLHQLSLNPHPFHFRHYTFNEVLRKLNSRFEILNWYGQNIYEFNDDEKNTHRLLPNSDMRLIREQEGQVIIFIFKKKDE